MLKNIKTLHLAPSVFSLQAKYLKIFFLLFCCTVYAGAVSAAEDVVKAREAEVGKEAAPEANPEAKKEEERIFIVNDYRYIPGTSGGNSDIGQSLCGTRCNALSVDYQNYLKPPGWRIIRIAKNKEVTVDLNNSYIDGSCICIADEYIVKVNNLYMTK